MNVIGYARVSTDKQENSIDAQRKRIQAQADLKDWKLSRIVEDEDEFSGNLNRPGVQQILELVRTKKVDAVIVTKLDRLTRSTRDAINLIELFGKKGVALISISESLDTESPMGRFFIRMIASIAELEREMIGSRTRDGLRNIKEQGFAAGAPPYGFRRIPRTPEEKENGLHTRLEPAPKEQEVMSLVIELRAQKKRWEDIAVFLNAKGFRTRKGMPFNPTDPHRIWKRAQAMNQVAA